MDSFQTPPPPSDPYERYRIEPIESERREKEQQGREPPEEKKGLLARMLQTLHQMVTFFLEGTEKSEESKDKKMGASLRALKAALETLKAEDRSEDLTFLHHFSDTWLHLLEQGIYLNPDTQAGALFKELLRKMEHYPERQTHTLGYYLSEYAGQKWIPFPYMELIGKIHDDHQKYPEISVLSDWTRLIDDLLLKLE